MENKAKEHYDNLLGNFYSWMIGDFEKKQKEQELFFLENQILPDSNKIAIDLGAGNGLQSISLAKLGFSVYAIDFNKQLTDELRSRKKDLEIEIIEADILDYPKYENLQPVVISCMGDTITHLSSIYKLNSLLNIVYQQLTTGGKFIVSYRDLTVELKDEQRFIPVKSDENRILTCFLEYFDNYVNVTDILYEKVEGDWVLRVSNYSKLKIARAFMIDMMENCGLTIKFQNSMNRMEYIIAEKVT